MTGVILQVRLDSTRLPGKALLKLEDRTVIEHAMRSLKKVETDIHIVATTSDSVEVLKPLAEKMNFEIYTGSKENVLSRFIGAIKKYNLSQFVRATGDNPLVSWELANILIELHRENNFDYSGFINNPVGTGVEVVNSDVLINLETLTQDKYDLEHVTPYLYRNKDKYKVFQNDAPQKYILKDSFVTIDTKADYDRIVKLFHELYHGETIPVESVIEWLKKERLDYTRI